jgi:hypothetical protein
VPYQTAEGTAYLSYGELVTLAKSLTGSTSGIQEIYEGVPLSNHEAQAVMVAANINAGGDPQAHAIIDTALQRLKAAA